MKGNEPQIKPFRESALEYDNWYNKNRLAYLSELEAIREALPPFRRAVEIGVGSGRFAAPLEVKWGVDPAREMLHLSADRGVRTIQAEGEFLPFSAGVLDCVLLIVTVCFVREPETVIEEARRVLQRGGYLIVGFVDRKSFLGQKYKSRKSESKFYSSARFFSAAEVLELLPEDKWEDIEIYQTIYELPEKISEVQTPKKGYGEGAFIVIRAQKTDDIVKELS